MLQQQMQAQQDRQWKMQEQQLDMGVKVAEFVARELQGVTDQARSTRPVTYPQVHPQAAAQMPQMYSKEADGAVQQRGIAMADGPRMRSLRRRPGTRCRDAVSCPRSLRMQGTPRPPRRPQEARPRPRHQQGGLAIWASA